MFATGGPPGGCFSAVVCSFKSLAAEQFPAEIHLYEGEWCFRFLFNNDPPDCKREMVPYHLGLAE